MGLVFRGGPQASPGKWTGKLLSPKGEDDEVADFLSWDGVKLGAPHQQFCRNQQKGEPFQSMSMHVIHFWIGLLMMAFSIFSPPLFPHVFHPGGSRNTERKPQDLGLGRLPRGQGALRLHGRFLGINGGFMISSPRKPDLSRENLGM